MTAIAHPGALDELMDRLHYGGFPPAQGGRNRDGTWWIRIEQPRPGMRAANTPDEAAHLILRDYLTPTALHS